MRAEDKAQWHLSPSPPLRGVSVPREVGVVLALQVPSRPQLHLVLHSFHLCHQPPKNLSNVPHLAFLYLFFISGQ